MWRGASFSPGSCLSLRCPSCTYCSPVGRIQSTAAHTHTEQRTHTNWNHGDASSWGVQVTERSWLSSLLIFVPSSCLLCHNISPSSSSSLSILLILSFFTSSTLPSPHLLQPHFFSPFLYFLDSFPSPSSFFSLRSFTLFFTSSLFFLCYFFLLLSKYLPENIIFWVILHCSTSEVKLLFERWDPTRCLNLCFHKREVKRLSVRF